MRATVEQAAKSLGVGERAIRGAIRSGELQVTGPEGISLKALGGYKRGRPLDEPWTPSQQLEVAQSVLASAPEISGEPMGPRPLAAHLIWGRAVICSGTETGTFRPTVLGELGLAGSGTEIALTSDPGAELLTPDDEGCVVLLDAPAGLRRVFELATLIVFGGARDCFAATRKLRELGTL